MIWIESPTNPTLTVIDIAAVSEIAHKKVVMEYIILYIMLCVCVGMYCCVVVDNTFLTPYFQVSY